MARHNPSALPYAVILITFYLHMGPFAGVLIKDLARQIDEAPVEPVRETPSRPAYPAAAAAASIA